MTQVLVTGADGFIGSHLTERLVREGYRVRALVQYNSFGSWGWLDESPAEVLSAVEVIPGDVRDPHGVRRATRGCDAVLHLAALIAIPYSYHSPDSYVDTNIRGTLNVLQACREFDVGRMIHTSTSEVYGSAQYVPIDEAHPIRGQSPYSATKIAADQLALSFFTSFATPITVLRPFNTYGPRQSARAVIPTVISQIAAGVRLIQLGALSPTRDFTYVTDTVGGFLAALRSDNSSGEVVNLGTGYEVSISQLAALIAEVMGVDIEIACDAERLRPTLSEVERLCADNSKARELLGWQPTLRGPDGLRMGLRATSEWFSDERNLAMYRPMSYLL